MSKSSETRQWALATAGVFCLCSIGYRVLTLPKIPDLAPVVANLNTGSKSWADASAQQAASVIAIERDIRAETWQLDRIAVDTSTTLKAASKSITDTSTTLNAQLEHVGPLLDSIRATSDAVPVALQHVSGALDGLPPVLAAADGAVGDFRRFITAPALADTLGNVDAMTGSWAGISADARKVTDKATADFLKPVPWYLWPIKRSGELLDIGAAVARHTP